jgi:hypothetical protein
VSFRSLDYLVYTIPTDWVTFGFQCTDKMCWKRTFIDSMARTTELGATNLAFAATADTSATPAAYISVCQIKPCVSLALHYQAAHRESHRHFHGNSASPYLYTKDGLAMQKKSWKEMSEVWNHQSEDVKAILLS